MTKQLACTLCGAGGHSAAQCNWNAPGALESIRLPQHGTTIALEEMLAGYLPDDREDVREVIEAYADIQARKAVMLFSGSGLASQQGNQATSAEIAQVGESFGEIGADGWRKIGKPAMVGAVSFGVGISSRLVVEAAQRHHEYSQDPAVEAERMQRIRAFAASVREDHPEQTVDTLRCTCPSGDGSLQWPCPEHSGGAQGEREAFEAYRDRRNAQLESEGHKPGSKWHVTHAHYATWEAARAALAQPSPAPELERPGFPQIEAAETLSRYLIELIDAVEETDSRPSWPDWTKPRADALQNLIAQHDRIVGALRADRELWAGRWSEAVSHGARVEEQRDAANSRLHEVATACATAEQERDADQARVAGASTILEVVARFAPGVGLPAPLHRAALDAHDWMQGEAPVAQAGQVPEWIACEDRMPPVNENVLVTCEFTTNDWRIKVGGVDERGNWWVFGASWTPSHWQPLPAAPAQGDRDA